MDQQIFWNNLHPSALETQSLPSSPVFSSEANIPCVDLTCDESADLSVRTSGGPSSNRHSPGEMENDWASSLTMNGSQESRTKTQSETTNMLLGSRIEQGRLETPNMIPLESVNLNLSSTQSFSQNSSFLCNLEQNAVHGGRSSQVLEAENFSLPFVPGSSSSVHVPSSDACSNLSGSSSNGTSFHGRHLSCKRKGIEGSSSLFFQGKSSPVHSVSSRQISNSALRIGTSVNVRASATNSYNVTGTGEGAYRNRRIRINPPQLVAPPPNQWLSVSNLRPSDLQSTHQAFNQFVPFDQSLDSRSVVASGSSDTQTPVFPVPTLVQNSHPFPVNAASSSRTGSSSRSSASGEETKTRHSMQHSSSWNLASTSQAGTSSQVQLSGPTWIPNQCHQRVLPEVVGRPLISSSRSGSDQSITILPQPSGSSNTLQELRNQSAAAVIRSLQQSYMRSANGVPGDPTSVWSLAAARESRSRVLSEICNALARRGEHIQLEDVLLYNHAVFYGRAVELLDRHRDMRLDVDNMSYEELLALEERIGNVNTGLSEETILMCLKQRKYILLTEETPSEVEPCCICQENYVEEEDVGRLNCGHDFHSACIKQWLMLKNLCPICRTTGLVK